MTSCSLFVTRRDVPPTNNVSEQRSAAIRDLPQGDAMGSARPGVPRVTPQSASVTATGVLRGLSAVAAIRTCLAGGSVLTAH